ncbi:MAG: hypothetical protein GEU81_14810 [Nitriliruptorales bacterium]|nr:hypothetical protein [Nitriliruptorales bacterium]
MPQPTTLTVRRRWLLSAIALMAGVLLVIPLWNGATTAEAGTAGLLGLVTDTTGEVSVRVDETGADLSVGGVRVTTSESPAPSEPEPTPAPQPTPAPRADEPAPAPPVDEPGPAPQTHQQGSAAPAAPASDRPEIAAARAVPEPAAEARGGRAEDTAGAIQEPGDETRAGSDGLAPLPLSAARARSEMAEIRLGQQDPAALGEPVPDGNPLRAGVGDAQNMASPAPDWDRAEQLQLAGVAGLGIVAIGLLARLLLLYRPTAGRRAYQPRHARADAERIR